MKLYKDDKGWWKIFLTPPVLVLFFLFGFAIFVGVITCSRLLQQPSLAFKEQELIDSTASEQDMKIFLAPGMWGLSGEGKPALRMAPGVGLDWDFEITPMLGGW